MKWGKDKEEGRKTRCLGALGKVGKREKIEAQVSNRGRRDEGRELKDKGHKQRDHNQRILL